MYSIKILAANSSSFLEMYKNTAKKDEEKNTDMEQKMKKNVYQLFIYIFPCFRFIRKHALQNTALIYIITPN